MQGVAKLSHGCRVGVTRSRGFLVGVEVEILTITGVSFIVEFFFDSGSPFESHFQVGNSS